VSRQLAIHQHRDGAIQVSWVIHLTIYVCTYIDYVIIPFLAVAHVCHAIDLTCRFQCSLTWCWVYTREKTLIDDIYIYIYIYIYIDINDNRYNALVGHRMVIYGGRNADTVFQDVHTLDLHTWHWSTLPPPRPFLSMQASHEHSTVHENNIRAPSIKQDLGVFISYILL
jgi:hypothetical protein